MPINGLETALVTGAASGMGRAITAALQANAIVVHAVDRDPVGLAETEAQTGCETSVVDLTDGEAIESLAARIDVDILVNNAGVLLSLGSHETMSRSVTDTIIDVNLRAPLQLTRLLLPAMVERDRGHLFMLGSSAGITPHANLATYSATKAAIHMFCRALRCDLIGKRIRITEIAPGRVQSRIYEGVLGDADEVDRQLYQGFDAIQPSDIADLVVRALEMPPHIDVTMFELFPTMQAVGGATTVKA